MEVKDFKFKPDIKESVRSLNQSTHERRKVPPIQNIKGVQTHMQRILEAKQKKIEDA